MCVSTDEGSKESKTEISKGVVGSYPVVEVVDHHVCALRMQWTESLRLKSTIKNHLCYSSRTGVVWYGVMRVSRKSSKLPMDFRQVDSMRAFPNTRYNHTVFASGGLMRLPVQHRQDETESW